MGNFHPAQHVVAALNKDPTWPVRFSSRRIHDLSLEHTFSGAQDRRAKQQPA
jgi:hypothetical protein